jgi:Fe-S-cluster containining protein
MAKPRFFEQGIRFECQGTGQCCLSRNTYGYVYLTPTDRARMAKVLGLTESEFERTHCTRTEGLLHLKSPDQDCQFLEGKRCGVYAGRPEQCRTWPFWPEVMNAKTWKKEVLSFCPGVGKGERVPASKIQEQLKTQDDCEEEILIEARRTFPKSVRGI